MHIVLVAEIPFVPLVPHTGNHFAAVQKAISKYLWRWVCLVPNEKLKRIKLTVKRFVPFPNMSCCALQRELFIKRQVRFLAYRDAAGDSEAN